MSRDGINALEAVLTEAEFKSFKAGTAETGGGVMHSVNAFTMQSTERKTTKARGPGLGGDVLGVARGFLRSELLKGFEDKIVWNKSISGYERTPSGVIAHFTDGTRSNEGVLLVAADGLHSRITRQLTDGRVRAYDTGARMIHGQTLASVFKDIGEGVWFLNDDERRTSLITNVRLGSIDDDTELGWILSGGPGSFDAPNGDFSVNGKTAADLSRDLTSKWHPKLRKIFELQNDAEAAFLKMSTSMPQGVPEWKTDPRVTLLGDAVHCMTPAGGVGANSALWDAELLGRMLTDGWSEGLTAEYERQMREFASPNVRMSFQQAAERFSIKELK